jgi:glyoxylase-like metal-dependent hydrolase (beta-lactamase superfamily II)
MKSEKDTSLPVELRPNMYQLPAEKPGSHVYLIKGESKNILIDTGMTANFARLANQLQKLGLSIKDIHFVILTHEHFDHIGATSFFETAVIAAHSLAANKIELQDEFVTANKYRNVSSKPFYAHLWLEDRILVDLGNYKLQVIHTPGHTSGCICLYAPKEKVLFSGDTVFAGGLLSDIASSGNISDYLSSLQRLGDLKVEALYPGHGQISSTPEADINRAVGYARTVMEESKLLFEALLKSESRAKILQRMEKASFSGMARPTRKPKIGDGV